ncbi:MAG TPA: hypothetical protein VKL21_08105 [Candidatus Methanoperedens sp.]|nr:hypothetical protein [Candidatus Methanoperedens sp.]
MLYEKYETRTQFYRRPWNRLTAEEKEEIIIKSNLKKIEEMLKENKKKVEIMTGKQRTIDDYFL